MKFEKTYNEKRPGFLKNIAKSVRKQPLKRDVQLEAVKLANALHCVPPLDDKTVEEIFEDADNPFPGQK